MICASVKFARPLPAPVIVPRSGLSTTQMMGGLPLLHPSGRSFTPSCTFASAAMSAGNSDCTSSVSVDASSFADVQDDVKVFQFIVDL